MSCPTSSLPCLWIIEYLTKFNQVDISILQDLCEIAPELPDDLGENTREAVALRLLEDLFGVSNRTTIHVPPDSRVRFDLSESCEHVLQCILQESSVANLRKAGPELLKWDIQPFIFHKRASMTKCALEQLKDKILEGSHPYAADLKERSGLVPKNEFDQVPLDDGDHDANAPRVDEKGSSVQAMAQENCSDKLSPENGNGILQGDSCEGSLSPSKRGRGYLASKDLVGVASVNQDSIGDHDDFHLNAKRLRHDNDDILVNEGSNAELRSVNGAPFLRIKCQGSVNNVNKTCQQKSSDSDLANGTQKNMNPAEAKADDEHACQEELLNDNEGFHSERIIAMKNMNPAEAKADDEHTCQEELLNDNEGFHSERIIAMKKSHFLSSKCTSSPDLLGTASWTKQNCCVKCNRDGQLLVCSASDCPLVVHERCLGFPAKFDDKGDFYCPFCAYSRSISEYIDARKEASLARKELTSFIVLGMENCSKDLDQNQENRHLGKKESNQVNQNRDDISCKFQSNMVNKQESEPSMSCVNVNIPESSAMANFSSKENEGKGKAVQDYTILRELEMKLDGDDSTNTNPSDEGTKTFPVQNTEVEGDFRRADLPLQIIDPAVKPICALNIDGEETDGDDESIRLSDYYIKFRRQKRKLRKEKRKPSYSLANIPPLKRSTSPAILPVRRRKTPWTAEEEEVLKEGVQKFAGVNGENFPWTKIFNFGASVFSKNGRTTVDLKDKWRNMCKCSPKDK